MLMFNKADNSSRPEEDWHCIVKMAILHYRHTREEEQMLMTPAMERLQK